MLLELVTVRWDFEKRQGTNAWYRETEKLYVPSV